VPERAAESRVPHPRLLRSEQWLYGAIGVAIGFYCYGGGRTFGREVGPALGNVMHGLLAVAYVVAFVGAWFLLFRTLLPRSQKPAVRSFAAFLVGLLLGAIASEVAISVDERQFDRERLSRGAQLAYDRPRAWPNGSGGLVYIPGRGTHATD
jgi:hypothetical protein